MQSFSKKSLKVTITINAGGFGNDSSGQDSITLEGFRTTALIKNAGGQMNGTAEVRIYGVDPSDMRALTTIKDRFSAKNRNTIDIYAVQDNVDILVFSGEIVDSWADYQNMPDVNLYINAMIGYFHALKPTPPRSFKGPVDVATVLKQIAEAMGKHLENGGVTNTFVTDCYLSNCDMEQFKLLADQADIFYDLSLDGKTIFIAPKGQTILGSTAVVNSSTGLIGYPTYTAFFVDFKTLFNPALRRGMLISLSSDSQTLNGNCRIDTITHDLESEKPDGKWFTQIRASYGDYGSNSAPNKAK
jgi:hypothetical protein